MVYIFKIPKVMRRGGGGGGVCKVMITLRDELCFRCELVTWVDHISYHRDDCQVQLQNKSLSLFSDHARPETV